MVAKQLLRGNPYDQQLLEELGAPADEDRLQEVENLLDVDLDVLKERVRVLQEDLVIAGLVLQIVGILREEALHHLRDKRDQQPENAILRGLSPGLLQHHDILANIDDLREVDHFCLRLNVDPVHVRLQDVLGDCAVPPR